ncbi:MAG: hypothetical protein JSW47_20290, partial [Phycisphaerales bacterium]
TGYVGASHRETQHDQIQNEKCFAGGSVEFKNEIRTSIYAEEGPYRRATNVPGVFSNSTHQDRYYNAGVDFNTRSNSFSYGVNYAGGQLGGGDYEYVSVYAWWKPINEVYLNLSSERTDSFGIFKQTIVGGSWQITPEDSLGARYIFSDSDYSDEDYFRVAYGRKARKGVDIFMVYDKDPFNDTAFSIKVVCTF